TDPELKDIYSIRLLAKTYEMVSSKGFAISNVDSTIFAEAPELSPYREEMQKNIAQAIQIEPNRVNVKATTSERLGIIGKGEGIAAMCIVLLRE
ncbi:MAG: 2-C-methyl-D-erythritol 2,4-cyclodiphosphate synthase, partial [Thermodesulfobacteriota bacterium]|nr:2-C-methyl-D-erythritol 2,4-cyclodiphosphate synthase [Thermodesulfobacteriota bacterium]